MDPILVTIGNFQVRWYSVLIAVALLIAYFGVMMEAARFRLDKNFLVNLIFWTVLIGIIGARLYYVAFNWDYYSDNLNEIYQIWKGGLAIHGGLIFGILTIFIYCKRYKYSTFKILDMFAPFMLLAQAIGRWGNFFNAEAYGSITTYEKLKELYIPEFVIKGMYINGYYHLPMFYFESLWCLFGVIFLLVMRRIGSIKKGQIASLYLMWYSLGRFFIEMFRTDSLLLGSMRIAQVVSVILFFIGWITLLVQATKKDPKDLYNSSDKGLRY